MEGVISGCEAHARRPCFSLAPWPPQQLAELPESSPHTYQKVWLREQSPQAAGRVSSHSSEIPGAPGRMRLSEWGWATGGPPQRPLCTHVHTDSWTHTQRAERCTHRTRTRKCDLRGVIGLQNNRDSMPCRLPFWPGFKGPRRRAVSAPGTLLLTGEGKGAPPVPLVRSAQTEPRPHSSLTREATWGEGAREARGCAGTLNV